MSIETFFNNPHWNLSLDLKADSHWKLDDEGFLELEQFHNEIAAGQNAFKSLASAKVPGNATIVSGQQLGFGISPILTFYKILSLEYLAKTLSRKYQINVIPVFWLQNEDHDLEECLDYGFWDVKGSLLQSTLDKDLLNDNLLRKSISDISLKQCLKTTHLDARLLANTQFDSHISKILCECYGGNQSLSKSFAKLFYSLFPNSPIVLFDPNLSSIKKQSIPIYLKSFKERKEIENTLSENHSDSFSSHVKILPKSPLFFFHPEKNGSRYRLVEIDETFKIPQLNFNIDEKSLEELIRNDPTRFSSSALLRPLIQDYLLGTSIQIVGDSEKEYLSQVKKIRPIFQSNEPMLFSRPKGLVYKHRQFTHAQMQDFLQYMPYEEFKETLGFDSEVGIENYDDKMESISTNIHKIFPELDSMGLDYINKRLGRILKKAITSSRNRNNDDLKVVTDAWNNIYSEAKTQERVLSLIGLIARFGLGVIEEVSSQFSEQMKQYSQTK